MRWKEKLTKKELKHIKETTGRATLGEFQRNRKDQIGYGVECFACQSIARKLGLE